MNKLKATPTARVQVMDRTLQVHAEELSTDEAIAFWPYILRVAPGYARYQKATSRTIPLVHLAPVGQAGEQTMPSDEALPGREETSSTERCVVRKKGGGSWRSSSASSS